MFPEHAERSFLDPEYSLTNTPNYIREAKIRPIKDQLYLPNTPSYVREQMFAQLRTGFTRKKRKIARRPRTDDGMVSVDVEHHVYLLACG